jgi:PKD repeat protein
LGACWNNGTGYASIEQVQITDGSGNVVYNKAADGANQCPGGTNANAHYNLIESTSAFTLSAGATYTVSVSSSNVVRFFNDATIGIWVDFNGDDDFADAGEFVTQSGTRQASGVNSTPGALFDYSFTVPCGGTAGVIRMRIRSDLNFYRWNANSHSMQSTYGETEDFACSYAVPAGLNADFFAPTTAFIGTQVNFTNANQSGYIGHEWTALSNTSSSTNLTEIFPNTGTFDVKLVSENCLGKDSLTKTVSIINPPAPPVANFVSDKNLVEIFETFKMYDLSSNGATFWDWTFIKGTDTIDGDLQPQLRGNNPNINKNPTVNTGNFLGALSEGTWNACLKATNSRGAGLTFCKSNYITVTRTSFNMDASTNQIPAGIITATSGTIYDNGGPDFDYSAASNLQALIAPCGAQSVTINFTKWDLLANARLELFDGLDASAPSLGLYNQANPPTAPITANSGALYMLWNSTGGNSGEGFEANWTTVEGTGAAPIANFTLPGSTLYNYVFVDFINTSQNAEGSTTFEWTVSGPGGSSSTVATRDLLNQVYTTNGTYTISLKVTSCDGVESTSTQTFTVVVPSSPTNLDFTASNQRPELGEDVTFTALSDKANRWEWEFFPPQGIAAVAPTSEALSERTFTFNAAGSYTVQLRGFNTLDTNASEATVVKTAYIIVVESCVPIISVTTSADVGINYFSITNPISGDMLFENATASGVDGYTDYSDLGAINLNFGGTYNFEITRPTNVNPMSRKLWIDWNVDGTFQPSEAVATEATANTLSWTGSFTVPDASTAFEANSKLRIGVSYDTDPNEPCGANSNPAANRIGEFEDYTIRVVNDGDIPVITLMDADTVYIEQSATPAYVSAGATANDPSQGDITSAITVVTDVDQDLPGIYYEDYNVADASGNEAIPVRRVVYVVSDQTAPVITINGSSDTTIEVGSVWTDLPATALDNKDGNLSGAIIITGMVDANLLGTYTLSYSVQDNQGNLASAERIVRVVDRQVPIIENASADKTNSTWTVEVQLQNIFADITTASDNYNNLGAGLTLKANPASPQGGAAVDTRFQGTTTVTYTATDESGNITTQEVDYIIRDFIAPVINLRTLDVVNHPVGSIYVPVQPSVTDNLYNNSEISLVLTSTDVDGFTIGTYTDVYTATDAAGNTSTTIRTVNVTDDVAPKISGKNGGVVRLGVGSAVNAEDYLLFSDNYDSPADLRANHTLVYNNINLQEAGVYSAVFSTEDNSGNVSNEFTILFDVQYNYAKITNSVNDLDANELLTVSPNPSAGDVNIAINLGENETINLAVYNAMGQVVKQVVDGTVSSSKYTVNLADQANGVYFVRMAVKDHIVTKRIVVNK